MERITMGRVVSEAIIDNQIAVNTKGNMKNPELHRVSVLLTTEVLQMLGMISREKNLNRSQAIEMCLHAGMTSMRIVKRGHKFDQKRKAGLPKNSILNRPNQEISSKTS